MSETKTGRVLIIAGSDSSGGAGIQADIKACAAFGAYSMTAVTAITAQNTQGVKRVDLVDPDMVRAQIDACVADIGVDVVKIGMLGSEAIIRTVFEAVEPLEASLVLDPVMVATSGDRLLEEGAVKALKELLIPIADLVTPNVPEAEILTGLEIRDTDELSKAGEAILEKGAYAALMKGAHLDMKSVVDVLVSEEGASVMTGPRLHTRHTHGTGCTLASAVAAALSLGTTLEEAVTTARDYVFEAIRTAPKLGQGNGPLNHGLALQPGSEDADVPDPANPFAALKGMGGLPD
ncbi:bifunctional hydroxymethylpyrimidine kinase/phosphomethylpyrimidine kinase [uncultured Algimonas sp.]|uniref:bifunctional hydroxymethylpyrimidine kinase/phosphomethylpyrimidine kinase n=1 Tax=uncultured Algimonas sp. TaxID=1547920 RepID=UPI002606953A|nr:bifunctional hydroxymethylpyrimidine kinase/phosphomethylpyrimidine kinase [uncultured Algimonas sp.]